MKQPRDFAGDNPQGRRLVELVCLAPALVTVIVWTSFELWSVFMEAARVKP